MNVISRSFNREITITHAKREQKMSESTLLLICENICKDYYGHEILRNISLEVSCGEKIVILGPSGAGKSTLLRCLHLLEPVKSGKIFLEGELINGYYKNESFYQKKIKDTVDARKKMATVFQSFNLFPHMTVLQNIIEGPTRTLRIPREQAVEKALRLLEKIGLQTKKDSYPSQLSGGQQQRVAIIRAIAMSPILMFFDEVTSALDPQLVKGVLDLMRELGKEGMTMMIVTHELGFAKEIADRIIFMEDGEIIETGDTNKLFYDADHQCVRDFFEGALKGKIDW
jgi:polar amino acid transport system ATP-binding protein